MKRLILMAVVCAFMAAPAMAGLSWNYEYVDSATHDLSSPHTTYDGFTVDTFNTGTTLASWTYSGDFRIINFADSRAARPYDAMSPGIGPDSTYYMAIPKPGIDPGANTGSASIATVSFGGGKYKYLGLHWGSQDNFNEIAFFLGGALQDTIDGDDVNEDGNGNQTDPKSNRYVNIFTDFWFDSIELRSWDLGTPGTIDPYAFELDNLTVAIPVPGAVLLGLLGLSAAGIKLRRFA